MNTQVCMCKSGHTHVILRTSSITAKYCEQWPYTGYVCNPQKFLPFHLLMKMTQRKLHCTGVQKIHYVYSQISYMIIHLYITSQSPAFCPIEKFTFISNLIPILLAEIKKKPVTLCVIDSHISRLL